MHPRVVIIAFMLMFCTAVNATSTLNFIAEDLHPYHFKNENGQADGALVDLAKAVLKNTTLSASFEIMPMARAFHELESNPNTILLSLLKTPTRTNNFIWLGDVYFTDAYVVSLKSSKAEATHLNHTKFYKIGTIRGYSSAKYLQQMGFTEDKNLVLVSYYQQLWQMLYKKRIDFVLMNTLTLNNELKMSGLDPSLITKRIHLEDFPSTLYFAANKMLDAQTANTLSDALEAIKQSGEYNAILNKWQLPLPNTANKL
ncbi:MULTISPECIES: transporter substrate-binding domain-containing protein [unclassified Pseudoalteromonas]|uniref:substrate-binding periplasmic protein n=1 Tax=unclassified Pseudoalteromonas TaxID=194690 RepID=UPI00072FEEDB|nr:MULTISPECIES: transporter substrate-binding domain-containing protein [unclassified Pseudoalteromonas]KTD99117.1 amino acid ABC transporter substrate-binding protein [Pseudoalteromonas sp. H71]TMN86048.1 amino acid ABC transporter substrate-binding protein [Pseudoalteromonas sp. S410]TMN93373.1 amino acid ABC transporter substrate-binding protein [Pseudoalteromonas sp. S408]TMN99867.1 amino acid ABC transporter substrate-binding protein [Pseudoalteromonas sp. S407]TMO01853.1 amino acid ABC |tara:strand:+ start:529 stop:1299 length:771 start_codon:yes stop_codon:yes gene_type:complete